MLSRFGFGFFICTISWFVQGTWLTPVVTGFWIGSYQNCRVSALGRKLPPYAYSDEALFGITTKASTDVAVDLFSGRSLDCIASIRTGAPLIVGTHCTCILPILNSVYRLIHCTISLCDGTSVSGVSAGIMSWFLPLSAKK